MIENSITVIAITLNEEYHLASFIKNAKKLTNNIYILDSFSKDKTEFIANENDVIVHKRKFTNFGDQWNFAIKNCPIKTEWYIKIDPDERLSDELIKNIKDIISKENIYNGFYFYRRLWFMQKPVNVKNKVVRIWRKNKCRFSDVSVNEHPIISGKVTCIDGLMEHLDSKNLFEWVAKQNKYSDFEAENRINQNFAVQPNLFGDSLQRRMYIKSKYHLLPFKYFFTFLFNYFIKGAFKSGKVGLTWAIMRTFVFYLREVKYLEKIFLHETNNSRS